MVPPDEPGWEVEGPDESVGIFGYSVYHRPCGEVGEADEDNPELFTCPRCLAVIDFTEAGRE